jgi:protoheme IX farnesyltransferase
MATEPILAMTGAAFVPRGHVARATALADYWAMTKPDINLLIAVTTATAFCVAARTGPSDFPWVRLLHTIAGTLLVASGAATLNQWVERRFDARMHRTARRPVAAGRIEPGRALLSGLLFSLMGVAYLLVATGILPSLLATLTLLGYLFLYTPAKRATPLCTFIGALPGAMPPLIGWSAVRGRLDPEAWALFGILFLWQFPHFMAIAWMYRDDYDRAGYLVLPSGPARDGFVTLQTLLPLVLLLPLSLFPALMGEPSLFLGLRAFLLGLGFLYYGARFSLCRSPTTARRLLVASIAYLPALWLLMLLPRG